MNHNPICVFLNIMGEQMGATVPSHLLRWDLANFFCPGKLPTSILLFFMSQVAMIVCVSHHAQQNIGFL
jgi:hypothetical protein